MIGRTGIYLVHPDTSKLFRETIFSDAAPEAQNDINALGKAMLAGRSGMTQTIVDGNNAYFFYRPLERTGWSIAIVCPESDVFSRYNRLLYIVWTFIGIGLLLLMLFCYQTVRRTVQPLKLLAHQAQRIADGHFDEPLPPSHRRDSVGRLTNSFIRMQQSLTKSVADIRRVNDELEQRNEELTKAYQVKMEANKQKIELIQSLYHEIRTPLNIVCGFTQVLSASLHEVEGGDTSGNYDDVSILNDEEIADITERMKQSANDISRLTHELGWN